MQKSSDVLACKSYRLAVKKIKYLNLDSRKSPVFYKEVFCKINEELFAPLYYLDNGRPNFPVNIILSLEVIKNIFEYTDIEILDQFYFNFQVLYALEYTI